MSERKNKDKRDSGAKDHRKPREKTHKQTEKKVELDEKEAEKLVGEPGSDFYRSLKNEDAVLNISQDYTTKYDKKEVQSNWSKYEMPIPTYEDVEAEENMGDDYEQLIQTGLSSGSHFQFKHEKSWNATSEPTDYDKYFDIDPEALSLALSTLLFCERNDMDPDLFSESEFVLMESETEKYKELYENKLTGHTITVQSVIDKIQEDIDNFKQSKLAENYDERIAELSVADVLFYNMETHFPMCNEPVSETEDDEFEVPDEEPIASTSQQDIEPTTKEHDLSTGTSSAVAKNKPTDQSPEELEKWLDDFLDN